MITVTNASANSHRSSSLTNAYFTWMVRLEATPMRLQVPVCLFEEDFGELTASFLQSTSPPGCSPLPRDEVFAPILARAAKAEIFNGGGST